jgi:hypothetical protein
VHGGPGSEGYDRGRGQGEARATVALAQGRTPVNTSLRAAAIVMRRPDNDRWSGLRSARLHIGAGQAAQHGEVEGEKQSKQAHWDKGTATCG